MIDTSWDIDKYKSQHESEEHWGLRRQFMVAHKDKFPEFRLVCLTQVFFNMEFMGCRYPAKTMELVNKLAEGVAKEFRDSRKGKLKRTFVGAQDAAGAKAKRAAPPQGSIEGSEKKPETIDLTDSPAAKRPKMEDQQKPSTQNENNGNISDCPLQMRELVKKFILVIPPRANSKTEEDALHIMTYNFGKHALGYCHEGSKKDGWTCELKVDPSIQPGDKKKPSIVLAKAHAMTQRQAKQEACDKAVELLRAHCSVIEPNPRWFQDGRTPDFIRNRIQCDKNPRTYLLMTKKDTGHLSAEVADKLMDNFKRSSNEDMFFLDKEFNEKEKINLMNRAQNHQLGFRHFGNETMLKDHHVCIYKKKTAEEILEDARNMGMDHPKYIITLRHSN